MERTGTHAFLGVLQFMYWKLSVQCGNVDLMDLIGGMKVMSAILTSRLMSLPL